jgi:sugar/nucleoside kinase (ribokinase family)
VLSRLAGPALLYARCAEEDRDELLPTGARYVPGRATACFEFSYVGDRREMSVVAAGDAWAPEDLPALDGVGWVHVAALLRSDFPAATIAALAPGRRVLLDGQGLVRPATPGPLVLDARFDPEALRHVTALKLAEEEADVLGDPAALGVAEVLVTHGSRGATVYAGGRVERVAGEPVDADPTGSGDVFALAYGSARDAGGAPVDAARAAAAVVTALLRER